MTLQAEGCKREALSEGIPRTEGAPAALPCLDKSVAGPDPARDGRVDLVHQLNGVLATVLSIASLTQRHTAHPEQFIEAFNSRIRALAQTHALLLENGWTEARLASVVTGRLHAYATRLDHDVIVEGGEIRLNPKAALALSSTLHELASNAARHGSLSVAGGAVHVRWHLCESGDDPRLVIEWRESGGPPVETPKALSLGTRLIRMTLSYELGGCVDLNFHRAGVHCRLELPVRRACTGSRVGALLAE